LVSLIDDVGRRRRRGWGEFLGVEWEVEEVKESLFA
jgi:hypothetical protein